MINIKIDETRREGEEIILNARKEASEMIENSEREGKKAAQEYYEKEMEKLNKEIEQLKNQGNQQANIGSGRGRTQFTLCDRKNRKNRFHGVGRYASEDEKNSGYGAKK